MKYLVLVILCFLAIQLEAQIGKVNYGNNGFNLELYPEPDKSDCCDPKYIRWALLQNSNTNIFTDDDKEYLYDLKNEILDDLETCSCETDYLDEILDSLITDIVILSNFDPYDFDYNDDTISLKRLNVIKIPTTQDFEFAKLKIGDYVITEGYYEPFDGGGARYIIKDSAIVNNINVFSTELGYAELVPDQDNRINIQQMGASPSKDNNSPMIQKAIELFDHVYSFAAVTFPVVEPLILKSNLKLEFSQFTEFRQRGPKGDLMLSTPGYAISDSTIKNVYIEGGIFNYDIGNRTITGVKNGALGDYAFLLNDVRNVHIKNMTVKDVPKYAFSLGDFNEVFFDNIYLETNSDGIHVEGPGKVLEISNIYGYTGDDFIAVACANWSPNAYTRGDISNVTIQNIYASGHPYGEGSGNIVALWAGNSGLGGVGTVPYTLSNVTINNIYGFSDTGTVVNLANYGTKNDPSSGPSYGGVVKNISISNIYAKQGEGRAQIALNCYNGENINLSNIYSANELSAIEIRGVFNYINMENIFHSNLVTPSIVLSSEGHVDHLNISNSVFSITSDQPIFKFIPVQGGMNFTLNNTTLIAEPDQSQIFLDVDDLTLSLINTRLKNSYVGFKLNGTGTHNIYLDNMVFENTHQGIGASSECEINLHIDSYEHIGGADYNTFRSTGANVVTRIVPSNPLKDNIINTSTGKNLLDIYPIGTTLNYLNTSNGDISIQSETGLINNSQTIIVNSRNLIKLRKISDNDWDIESISVSDKNNGIGINSEIFSANQPTIISTDNKVNYSLPLVWNGKTGDKISFINKSAIIKTLVGNIDQIENLYISIGTDSSITFIWDGLSNTWWRIP